jgi:hypothetical protein
MALKQLTTADQRQWEARQWRWLRPAIAIGAVLGAIVLGVIGYASWTPADNTGLFPISRSGQTAAAAIGGAIVGVVAGFVTWALWVLLSNLARHFVK